LREIRNLKALSSARIVNDSIAHARTRPAQAARIFEKPHAVSPNIALSGMHDKKPVIERIKMVCRVCRSEFLVDHASLTLNRFVRCKECTALCSIDLQGPPTLGG
jgi:predicted Zn finger-like uncharacterized protein